MKGIDVRQPPLENRDLREAINDIPGGFARYQLQDTLKTLMYTDGIARMHGYTREEYDRVVGRDVMDIIYEADRPMLSAMIRAAAAGREELHVSYRAYCRDGGVVWLNLSAYPTEYGADEAPVYDAILSSSTTQFNLYRDICDNSTTGIMVFDKQTDEIYYANENMSLLIGTQLFPCTGQRAGTLLQTDFSDGERFNAIQTMPGSGKVAQFHTREIRWLNREAILLYAADITAEYRRQEELQQRYEDQVNYSRMLSAASAASSMVNLTRQSITHQDTKNGEIMSIITRRTPQEGFEAMYTHIPDNKLRWEYAAVFDTETIIADFEKGITHKSVRHPYESMNCWLESSYDALRNPRTGDLEVYCFAKDISQDELQKSVVKSLLLHEYDDVILLDPQTGRPTILVDGSNGRFDAELETPADYGESIINFILEHSADDDPAQVAESVRLGAIREALETQEIYTVSYSLYDENRRIKRFRASYSYLNPYKSKILCTIQDVTRDFEIEVAQREALQNALAQAQQAMKAKTDFMANMSHDIRTPLNVIMGMSHLAGENDNPRDTQECLENIKTSSEFLLGLVNDFLDIERVEGGKIELHLVPYSSRELRRYISAVIEPMCARKHLCFRYTSGGSDEYVLLQDKLRVNQVYYNLLSNAVKFTPEGGTVEFHTEVTPAGDRLALDVTISDTGIGMSEEFQAHLYEPFAREDQSAAPGTGLGLAFVKQVCDLMGLSISVRSTLGQGTTFALHGEYAPAPDSGELRPGTRAAEDDALRGKVILACEDHPLNQKIISRLLEKKGAAVIIAEDGKCGVEAFQASSPGSIFAILMDIRMPVMDGLQAAVAIRALPRADAVTVPIIALSANAYEEDVRKCMDAGMTAHLAKPVEPAQLYSALRKLTGC